MYDDGYSIAEISTALLLSDKGKHLIDHHKDKKLKTENGGSYSKITVESGSRANSSFRMIIIMFMLEIWICT